jgi:hypothetical protein
MGFFDIFTDAFTGDPAHEAADNQRALFNQQAQQTGNIVGVAQQGGIDTLASGRELALNSLAAGYDQARTDIGAGRADITGNTAFANDALNTYLEPSIANLQSGTQSGAGALYRGEGTATNAISSGAGNARTALTDSAYNAINASTNAASKSAEAVGSREPAALAALQSGVADAVGAYAPLSATSARFGGYDARAAQASEDALGLNGPAGIARAQATFRAGPGYDFAVDEGLNSIARNANASGMVAGGNQLRESQRFGQGLADQEFERYRDDLFAREGLYAPLEASSGAVAAKGVGDARLAGGQGAANIITGTGSRLADIYGREGSEVSSSYNQLGGRLGESFTGEGTNLANVATGTGARLSDLYSQEGTGIANLLTGVGSRTADNYTQAGRSLAGIQGQLGDVAGRAGAAAAGVNTGTAQSISDLLAGLAKAQIGFNQSLVAPTANTFTTDAQADLTGSKNFVGLLGDTTKFVATGGLSELQKNASKLLS